MERKILLLVIVSLLVTTGTCTALTDEEKLGKALYFDTDLSAPVGMSCASCHDPAAGFADPYNDLPVSQGILPERYGNRNSPTSAYAAYSPTFDPVTYVGGQFWDGRAADLVEQAKGPFLNPLEMHNPSKLEVVIKIRNSDYAVDFERLSGLDLSDMSEQDIEDAYHFAAVAIAAYESSEEVNQFSSKYDLYVEKKVKLDKDEARGLVLFEKYCADCHSYAPEKADYRDVFTTYTYHNLGTPRNEDNPFYYIASIFNPDGVNYIDYGLGGIVGPEEDGKMKVPTLRNIAVTSPYMHNGVFTDLTEVVTFLDTPSDYEPEVEANVEHVLDDKDLTEGEVADIIAFLETLTDGYAPGNGNK